MGGRSTTYTVLFLLTLAGFARAGIGIPENGLDLVQIDDGRVFACRVGEDTEGMFTLEFPTVTFDIPKERVREIRFFRDFDPTPHTPAEKTKVAKGLIRWKGKWLAKRKVATLRKREEGPALKRQEEDDAHALWENRRIVETKNFHFESNLSLENLEYYMNIMEEYYAYFTRAFGIKLTQREKKSKLPLLIFRQRDEFMKFREKDTGGNTENVLGYFAWAMADKGEERLVMFDLPGGRRETVDVLFHEGTHFLLYIAEPQVILNRWLHEGMAEYFGSADPAGKKFEVGAVQDNRLLAFQTMVDRKKMISWDEFFKAGNNDGGGIKFRPPHYAQAFVVVHFFLHGKGGKYRGPFIDYMKRSITGKGGVNYTPIAATDRKLLNPDQDKQLLFKCLKIKNMEQIEADIIEYAEGLPLRGADAYVTRGEIRYWNEKDPRGAAEDFRMALERGGEDSKVLAHLARVYSHIPEKREGFPKLLAKSVTLDPLSVNNRFDWAMTLPMGERMTQLKACIEIDPWHADACGQLGWMLFREQGGGMFRATNEANIDTVKEARRLMERSVDLDPSHDKLHALARLRLNLGDFEAAHEVAKKAVQLEPDRAYYRRTLVWILAVQGEAKAAAKEVRYVKKVLQLAGNMPEDGVNQQLRETVSGAVNACIAWEKGENALAFCDLRFRSSPPGSDEEWALWSLSAIMGGNRMKARELLEKGQAEYPDSVRLKNVQYRLDNED